MGLFKLCYCSAGLATLLLIIGCGSSGGASSSGGIRSSGGSPDFSLSLSPSSVTLTPTGSETFQIGFSPLNGFAGAVQMVASGIPAGVTLQPNSPFELVSTGTFVTTNVALSTVSGTYFILLQATSGSVTHSVTLKLTVAQGAAVSFPPSRNGFLPLGQEPFAATFDPIHKLVFASLPWLDAVAVVSTTTKQIIKTIPVPGPEGLDLKLDYSGLLVGTTTNQFYAIDTEQLAVTGRTTVPVLNPVGTPAYLQPQWPIVTANGTILVIATGDFPVGVFQWNPASGTLSPRPDASVGNTTRAARSSDGSKVLLWDWGGGGASIYDAAKDSFTQVQPSLVGFPVAGAVNAAGTQVAVASFGGPVIVTDGAGNLIRLLDAGSCFGLHYTVDGSDLLAVTTFGNSFEILTIDAATFSLVGTAPGYATNTLGVTRVLPWSPDLQPEIPLAVDDSGMIYGAADHGLALDNSKNFQNLQTATAVPVFFTMNPTEGALNSSTDSTIQIGIGSVSGTPTIYVGSQVATNVGVSQSFQLQFTVPPSNTPGVETVQMQQADGVTTDLPLFFSYGPTLVPQPQQALPPNGNVAVDLFGYGLGLDQSSFGTSLSIGGQNAPITSHLGGIGISEAYPFPIQHLQATAPPGPPGPADLLVASPVGATAPANRVRYLQDLREVASADSFSALAYDSYRNRLYLSAGDHIDVFDLAGNSFLPSISLPTANGSKKAVGLAMTPDGSSLLVSNQTDGSIGVIEIDNPSTATAVKIPFQPLVPDPNCMQGPGQIAASNSGKAYAMIIESGVDSCPSLGVIELDVPSLAAHVILQGSNPVGYISAGRLVASRNGTAMAINDGNNLFLLDPATDSWRSRQLDQNSNLYDVAVSADAGLAVLRTTSYGIGTGFPLGDPYRDRYIGVDGNMNVITSLVSPELTQSIGGGNVPGMLLNDSGSLIYAVQSHEIDLYDVHHGDELERILLPNGVSIGNFLSQTAIDETGARIFAITPSGLCIVTLDSVPLSIGKANPSSGSSAGGIQVTLRGSGFKPGAKVLFGNSTAATTVVDPNTLQVLTPPTAKGAIQVSVQDADGGSYTLDDAYTAN